MMGESGPRNTTVLRDIVRPERGDNSAAFRDAALAWFRAKAPANQIDIQDIQYPSANGMSAETFLFTLRIDGDEKKFVMRRDPKVNAIFVGMNNSHQARVIDALHKQALAPVPAIFGEERDPNILEAPFYVMEYVDGRIPPDNPLYSESGWVADLPASKKADLWWSGVRALSRVASLDWRAAGLSDLQKGAGSLACLEADLQYYLKLHRDHCDGHYGEFIASSLHWLRRNWPSDSRTVLGWGDARLGNMIFQDTRCVAIIDWEMSSIGPLERDLAWWFYIDTYYHEGVGVPRMPGWPSYEETEAEYGRLVGKTIGDLTFYKAFAAFRSTIISARFTALGLVPAVDLENYVPARVFKMFTAKS